jgi:acetylornithine deacetylase/succinyl-diaminopimelate desuccinylase-like protein
LLRTLLALLLISSSTFAQKLDPQKSQEEAVHFLSELVKIDTQDPPGNESKVAHYLEEVLKNEGIQSEILETVPGRDSIVARLKGNGSKKPLLIMGHEDVVPVDRAR